MSLSNAIRYTLSLKPYKPNARGPLSLWLCLWRARGVPSAEVTSVTRESPSEAIRKASNSLNRQQSLEVGNVGALCACVVRRDLGPCPCAAVDSDRTRPTRPPCLVRGRSRRCGCAACVCLPRDQRDKRGGDAVRVESCPFSKEIGRCGARNSGIGQVWSPRASGDVVAATRCRWCPRAPGVRWRGNDPASRAFALDWSAPRTPSEGKCGGRRTGANLCRPRSRHSHR